MKLDKIVENILCYQDRKELYEDATRAARPRLGFKQPSQNEDVERVFVGEPGFLKMMNRLAEIKWD